MTTRLDLDQQRNKAVALIAMLAHLQGLDGPSRPEQSALGDSTADEGRNPASLAGA